jgi:hypothetical protein
MQIPEVSAVEKVGGNVFQAADPRNAQRCMQALHGRSRRSAVTSSFGSRDAAF